jgi:hypothetical protein
LESFEDFNVGGGGRAPELYAVVCCGTEPAGEYTFFCPKGNENHELGTGIMSTVKRVQFVSDRMSYITNTKRSMVSLF